MTRLSVVHRQPSRWLRRLRLAVQATSLLWIVAVPLLSLYQSLVLAHAEDLLIGGEKVFFTAMDALVRPISDDPGESLDAVKGGAWSATLGKVKISDPLALVSQLAASRTWYAPFAVTIVLPLFLTLVFGRIFCGWVCPGNIVYEWGNGIRTGLQKVGIKLPDYQLDHRLKYSVLVAGTLAGFYSGSQLFPLLYPPAVLSRAWYLRVYTGFWGAGFGLFVATLILEIVVAERFFCRSICPGGALYTMLSQVRVVRLVRQSRHCTDCGLCNPACPMDLRPMEIKTSAACTLCGNCLAQCQFGALALEFIGRPKVSQEPAQPAPAATAEERGAA